MSYLAAGALVIGGVGLIGSGQTASAQASGNAATVKGQLAVQKAETEGRNAQSALANHMTALNNNRALTSYGKARAALGSSQWNQKDQRTANKLETGLRQAEQRGALVANMAFSGSGGASFDAIESSMRLRDARVNQNEKDVGKQLDYNMAQDMAGLTETSLSQLDMTVHSGSVNNASVTTPITGGTNFASAIAQSGMINAAGKLIQNLGTGSSSTSMASLGAGSVGLSPTAGGLGLSSATASRSFFNLSAGSSVSLW